MEGLGAAWPKAVPGLGDEVLDVRLLARPTKKSPTQGNRLLWW